MSYRSFKLTSTMYGIVFMLSHAIAMSFFYVILKRLSVTVNTNQIAFLYKFITLIIISLSCLTGDGVKHHLKTKKLHLHALRGLFSMLGSLCMFYAISRLHVTDSAALSKLEHSFMVLVGIFVFKEKVTKGKILLLLGSLLGAGLILNVKTMINKGVDIGYVFIFMALIFWVFNNTLIKQLGKTERSRAQLFYSTLFASILAFCVALPHWNPITLNEFYLIFLAAIASLIHKMMFFKAYKAADISVVSPFDYTRLIITASFAYAFFDEVPNLSSAIGYAIIMATGIYFILSEGKKYGFKKK